MKKSTFQLPTFRAALVLMSLFISISACQKSQNNLNSNKTATQVAAEVNAQSPAVQNQALTQLLTVAHIEATNDAHISQVMFLENAEVCSVNEGATLDALRNALTKNAKLLVTFDPWQAIVKSVATPDPSLIKSNGATQVSTPGTSRQINLATTSNELIDNVTDRNIINMTTSSGLTTVIPDIATAQSMFNYITTQCCALGGPYSIDYCISFQYCQDGCYARAQKMCYILNNKYHFDTHKIFSFANAGPDRLSVKADKWGGCCVTWWYHVAPLVNVKTPTGVKAYVFDPAMFDQPVLLSTWLHAQENPTCSGTANVTMINLQPTSSYTPAAYDGLSFGTDPFFSSTNSTLVNYSGLITCP